MKQRFWSFAAFLLMASGALVAPPPASAESFDRAVAMVDGAVITLSEVYEQAGRLQGRTRLTAGELREVLDRLINHRLLVEAAGEKGITVDKAETIAEVEAMIDEVRERQGGRKELDDLLESEGIELEDLKKKLQVRAEEQALVSRLISARVSINQEEVDAFKRERVSGGKPAELFVLRQILIVTPPNVTDEEKDAARQRAEAAHQQLEEGLPFLELVRRTSEDRYTRELGGLVGSVAPGEIDPAIRDALAPLKTGQFSKPVFTRSGWHIFLMERRRTARSLLRVRLFRKEQDKLIAEGREEATIVILDPRLKNRGAEESK
jgi:parvulin-like peptidyl-prolyl isomerase